MKKIITTVLAVIILAAAFASCRSDKPQTINSAQESSISLETTAESSGKPPEYETTDVIESTWSDEQSIRYDWEYLDKYSDRKIFKLPNSSDFYVVEREIGAFDLHGSEVLVFQGRYIKISLGYVGFSEAECYAIHYGDFTDTIDAVEGPKVFGHIIIGYAPQGYEVPSQDYTVIIDVNPEYGYLTQDMFDTITYNENSEFALCFGRDFNDGSHWRILDADGNWRSLPLPDENRIDSIGQLEFDPDSNDPDVVIVHPYHFYNNVEYNSFKYNLRDTKIVDYDYYKFPEGFFEPYE